MVPFYGSRSTVTRLQSQCEETIYFLPLSSQEFLYSFNWPWKDERLSQPWIQPVVSFKNFVSDRLGCLGEL